MRTFKTNRENRIITANVLAFATLGLACSPTSQTCEDSLGCDRGQVCQAQMCVYDEESTPGLTDEERESLGEGLGAGSEPTEYGAVIDSFCGIDARQNGPDPDWTPGYEGTYGYEYQCTELAFRLICQHFDLCTHKSGKFGNAKEWFDNAQNNPVLAQLTRYDNGGTEPPRPGDVLVSTAGTFGHVAIVKWVDADYVHVLEQNVYQGSHRYAISENNGTYTMTAGWRGWMRAPGGPASCEEGPTTCGCEGTLDTVSAVDGKLFVSGVIHCPEGIDKWSIAVHEEVVYSDFPADEQTVSFSELIDLSGYNFPMPDLTVGLWARPAGGDACLLDDESIVLQDDGCFKTLDTACLNGSVVHVDSCGEVTGVAETCSGNTVCVETSPTNAECQLPPAACGNGSIDVNEQCDGPNLGGATCESQGFDGGNLACSPVCTYDTTGCMTDQPYCGNGILEQGEQCDGNNLGGTSCVSLGYSGGNLECTNACTYNTNGCVNEPTCSYSISPEYPNSSYNAPYSCPGGVVMPISGSLTNNGSLTVSSPGKPGGYGAGTYRVLVFDPNDPIGDQCKPWNVVKASTVLNSTQASITFPAFNSLLTCSDSKAYCIVKEDGGSIAHFCSGKLAASYN